MVYSNKLVGCRVVEIEDECRLKLKEYFKEEVVATSMYQLNPEFLKIDSDGKAACFVGENNSELFYVESSNKLVKFNLVFNEDYFESSKEKNNGWKSFKRKRFKFSTSV